MNSEQARALYNLMFEPDYRAPQCILVPKDHRFLLEVVLRQAIISGTTGWDKGNIESWVRDGWGMSFGEDDIRSALAEGDLGSILVDAKTGESRPIQPDFWRGRLGAAAIKTGRLDYEASCHATRWHGYVRPRGKSFFAADKTDAEAYVAGYIFVSNAAPALVDANGEVTATEARSAAGGNSRSVSGGTKPRGRPATQRNRVANQMRDEIARGTHSAATLAAEKEEALAAAYGVSRETARLARNSVLSEIDGK